MVAVLWAPVGMAAFMNQGAEKAGAPIRWDPSTLTLVRQRACYGRMRRLGRMRLIATYELGGRICVSFSDDDGQTWGAESEVVRLDHGNAANPELLVLGSRRVLLFFNERPTDGKHPYAISMCRSSDGGRTWTGKRALYTAGVRFDNGCWEPAAIRLRDGTIQLFFANEAPFSDTEEQEISMIESKDRGESWGVARRVAFRPGGRDGMPVPILGRDGTSTLLAIEDSGLCGLMKPVIVAVRPDGVATPDTSYRWPALAKALGPEVYAGAPYLVQMADGATILSVQSTEGHRKPRMVVYRGDRGARSFASPTEPFDLPSDVEGLWNSLFVKSRNVVTAVSTTRIGGKAGVWAVDGHVLRGR